MMYDAKNEETEILDDVGKKDNGNCIRVSKVSNSRSESYDIRNMYLGDDGELKYAKGIRIKDDVIDDVIITLLNSFKKERIDEIFNTVNKE